MGQCEPPFFNFCLPVSVAERCNYRSRWSPAQHPPRAAGEEERSKGETGDPRLTGPREETQTCQEISDQETEWEKGRREG